MIESFIEPSTVELYSFSTIAKKLTKYKMYNYMPNTNRILFKCD